MNILNLKMEDVIVHAYDWKIGENQETGYTSIHSWCLDKNSDPYLLRFDGFDCFCYVELPLYLNNSYVRWDGFRQRLIYQKICDLLGDDAPYRHIFQEKEKYYYYKGKNKKYPMLLLCFHSLESMNKCKNKLKFAFKVNGLRGGNSRDDQTMVAVKVWETHIPLVRKLLTLRNSKFSQWFNIKGIKVEGDDKISTLEREYSVDWRTLNPISLEETVSWITHPKILSFDLETYSDRHNAMPDSLCSRHVIYLVSVVFQKFLEPETRQKEIILLGDCSDTNLANVIKVKNEMELINRFQDLILKYDPEIITGYNILGYDNPYLENRLKRRLKEWRPLGRLIGEYSNMVTLSWSSSAFKNQDFNILEMSGRISVDLLPVIKRDYKFPIYKLEYVANHFLGTGKHPVTAKQMFSTFELQRCLKEKIEAPECFFKHCRKIDDKTEDRDGNIDLEYKNSVIQRWKVESKQFALDEMRKVVDYCVVDSDLVIDLFDKINVWIGLIQTSNIMGIVPADIFTRGTGIRMQSQIYDEASKKNIVLDEVDFPKEPFKGAYVPDPIVGMHELIPIFDFKSLYPSLQISENMDHSTLVAPHLMNTIPDEDCHVIEWDEDMEDSDSDSDSDSDDEEVKKKKVKKIKTVHYKYKFVKEPIGIMPNLLTKLIAERNKIRKKQKEVKYESLEWNVLEQMQLSVKCSTNAFYGACGSNFSKLKCPPIAKAITAKGRFSTKKMNKYLESKGHTVVYGDSVTGDTPILIFSKGEKKYIQISDLMKENVSDNQKHYSVPDVCIKVWSDKGFTNIKYIMKHKTKKRLFCFVTTSGIIKVTEDHSLLNPEGNEICPKDLKIGDKLMVKEHPVDNIKEGITYKATVYVKSALEAMKTVERLKKFQHEIIYDWDEKKNVYKISIDRTCEKEEKGKILKIIDLGIVNDYVYDLETENHHFSAGVGELVVHNTDSTMPNIGLTDPKTAWEISEKLADELTSLYLKPMQVELEAIFAKMLCIKKKMYLCIYLDENGNAMEDPDKMKIRGVTLARRDNCKFQRDFYKESVWKIFHDENFKDFYDYIIDMCIKLLSHSISWEDLTMIKGLGSHYKSKTYMMNIFANEMQKSGNPLTPGDRIQYLVVKTPYKDDKVGYKMRTTDLFLERAPTEECEKIDCLHYLEKTVKNPIERQLYQVGYKKHLDEIEKKYLEQDCNRVLFELGKLLKEKEKNFNTNIYNEMVLQKLSKHKNDKLKVIEELLEDKSYEKYLKPLHRFHIKRRQGIKKRLSSRIDREPITMMVALAKVKEQVMESIRNYKRPKKVLKLKIK